MNLLDYDMCLIMLEQCSVIFHNNDVELFQLANTRKLISNEYLVALLAVSLMLVSQKMKQPHLLTLPTVPIVIGLLHNFDQQRDITLDTIKGSCIHIE